MVWSPGTGWQAVPGSEMRGNHGIEGKHRMASGCMVTALFERGSIVCRGREPGTAS